MGKRGPAPKPTALKVAAGNPGRRQLQEGEPLPPPGVVAPPAWLKPKELAIWAEVAPVCQQMRTLTTADRLTFARYCQLYARWLELHALVRASPDGGVYTILAEDGSVRAVMPMPQAVELRTLHQQLTSLEDRFGLSASARSRINVQPHSPGVTPAMSAEDQERRAFFAGGGLSPTMKADAT